MSSMIRGENYADAETVLAGLLRNTTSHAADLCADLPLDAVRIEGWDAFNERLAQVSTELSVTAVWLDLSNYTDDGEDGLRHPVIEIGYVKDGSVAFSRETRESLLAMCETYPAPWTGAPDEDGSELAVTGLAPLNDWLMRAEPRDAREAGANAAAQWFELLRYHQAIAATLAHHGLSLDIPVIVGEHGVGPWCKAVLYRSKPFTAPFSGATDPRKKARLDAEISYQVHEWENVRAGLEISYLAGTPAYYAQARDLRFMADNKLSGTPFKGTYPLEMSVVDFEQFLHRWRQFRDPTGAPPPTMQMRPRSLRGLFGRRGL